MDNYALQIQYVLRRPGVSPTEGAYLPSGQHIQGVRRNPANIRAQRNVREHVRHPRVRGVVVYRRSVPYVFIRRGGVWPLNASYARRLRLQDVCVLLLYIFTFTRRRTKRRVSLLLFNRPLHLNGTNNGLFHRVEPNDSVCRAGMGRVLFFHRVTMNYVTGSVSSSRRSHGKRLMVYPSILPLFTPVRKTRHVPIDFYRNHVPHILRRNLRQSSEKSRTSREDET